MSKLYEKKKKEEKKTRHTIESARIYHLSRLILNLPVCRVEHDHFVELISLECRGKYFFIRREEEINRVRIS